MKKISTLLGILLVGASFVKAEQQTMTVEYYDDSNYEYKETAYKYEVNITHDENGVYTIDNFLNSGSPLSFTLDRGVSTDSHTFINFVNNIETVYDQYGVMNTHILKSGSEESIIGKIVKSATDNTEIDAEEPSIFNGTDKTYVQLTNDNLNGNYVANISITIITGYYTSLISGEKNPLYSEYNLKFYFNGPEPNATPLSIKVLNEAGTSESNLPFTTTLAVDKDGVYTISNFLDSTQPMSFTFNPNDPNDNSIAVTLAGNVNTVESAGLTYNYITDPEGQPGKETEYLSRGVIHTQGETRPTSVKRPKIDLSKTYIKRVDKEENNGCNYMANFYLASNNGVTRNLQFYFTGPDKVESSLSLIQDDNSNAPIEYYNLNGQRVENPAGGIFVRKQGSKVEKVVIR